MIAKFGGWWKRQRWLTSPWLGALNVVFGVMAGVIAAAFNQDLINSTPILWINEGLQWYGDWNGKASGFWLMLVVFALLWAAREAVSAKQRADEILNLERLIETVAPPDFLEDYQTLYGSLLPIEAHARSDPTNQAKNLEGVRQVLDSLIQLAAKWDYRTAIAADQYRANVMLWTAKDEWSGADQNAGVELLGQSG